MFNLIVIKVMATMKEAVSTLLKNGAKRVENIVVNNVNVTPLEEYVRIALTLDKPVAGYVQGEDGTYTRGETSVIFVSLFSIAAMLKESDELAWAVNAIINNPNSLQVLFSRAKITLLQEDVVAGQVRVNPFTEKEDENVPDHDAIYNHIVDVKLGKMGEVGLEKMLDKLLGA